MRTYDLIFDGDDTLWENNVLFERAIEAFIDYLAHPAMSREEVRAVLDEIEEANSRVHGYGVNVFERSLGECLARLRADRPLDEADHQVLRRTCAPIRRKDVELLDGVPEMLRTLGERNRLFLLTKGEQAEQEAKIEASGLAGAFTGIRVVPEKDPAAYRSLLGAHSMRPESTWMIGNSPRSDIWPALSAGIGAVLVPHPMTWSLEAADLPEDHDRFSTVAPIGKLVDRF